MAEQIVEEKKILRFVFVIRVIVPYVCKHRFPGNTLTHSTNEDLLNIKRKGLSRKER